MSTSLVSLIDHALLHPTLTDEELRAGCELARQLEVATVCVKPYHVAAAAELLAGSPVGVSTVIGFPHGSLVAPLKAMETRIACEQGAREVDMVVNVGKVLSEDWDYVERDIRGVVDTAHSFAAITKVIFETDFVSRDEHKIKLCEICLRAGAEFVKTSTGFGFVKQPDGAMKTVGATEHDIRLMKAHCGDHLQVKASGGIRSYEDARRMVECGATRLGTSASEAIAKGVAAETSGY